MLLKEELVNKKITETKKQNSTEVRINSKEERSKPEERSKKEDRSKQEESNKKEERSSYAAKTAAKPKHPSTQSDEKFHPKSILIVADSHSSNLDYKVLENATNAKVDMAFAYTADGDVDAKYPHKNFLKVVPERLQYRNYDTLILQGGCNEISNIKLTTNPSSTVVREWEEKVRISRRKMFQLAEKSLKFNQGLKKVIILKSLPRYDSYAADPSSLKSKLNQFGNTLYSSIWMEKGCPENIVIEDQHMDCQGPLREKRFGNPGSTGYDGKPWDGVHMRGRLAVTHYTNSLIRILSGTVPSVSISSKEDYHQMCPQALYQQQQQHNFKGADTYQYKRRTNYTGGLRQAQQGTHKFGGTNRQGYQSQHTRYNVSVSNKYDYLGNY